MATVRIAGVTSPGHQHARIALRSVFGIGATRALEICVSANVDPSEKIEHLSIEQLDAIRLAVDAFEVEGDLRRRISLNIKRLMDLGSYRGIRHRRKLPCRGQNTKNNARTRKGKKKPVRR